MSRAGSADPRRATQYDKKKFQTIFPQYLDASLTPKEGRRLTKSQSVQCPSLEEIILALRHLGFAESFVDPMRSLPCSQSQSKIVPAPRGCVKVAIKAPVDQHYIKKSEFDVQNRGAVVEGFTNKMAVLRRVAEIIKEKGGVRPTPMDMTPAHQPKEANASSTTTSGGKHNSAPSARRK